MSEREALRWSTSSYSTGDVLSRGEIVVSQFADSPTEPAAWLDEARRELRDLKLLSQNWDSYGAFEVDQDAIDRASALLRQLASEEAVAPKPTIVASTEGGVRLQWDLRGIYVLIQFDPGVPPTVFYEEAQGQPWEGQLGQEPKPFIELLWEVRNF